MTTSASITFAGSSLILRIAGSFVAAYESMEQLEVALHAYEGVR